MCWSLLLFIHTLRQSIIFSSLNVNFLLNSFHIFCTSTVVCFVSCAFLCTYFVMWDIQFDNSKSASTSFRYRSSHILGCLFSEQSYICRRYVNCCIFFDMYYVTSWALTWFWGQGAFWLLDFVSRYSMAYSICRPVQQNDAKAFHLCGCCEF